MPENLQLPPLSSSASRPTAPRHSTATSVFSGHPNGTVALLNAVLSSPGLIHEGRSHQRHRRPPAASPFSARPGPRGAAITDLRLSDNTPATILRPPRSHRHRPDVDFGLLFLHRLQLPSSVVFWMALISAN
ncbi:hydroxyproline-rich glycoprotein family protein [Striga asiatica]|uniref:Hydroxyproline-rich glycoprotein family protein n=1 Tax=Striga asiatica TaxID=4170 RepID=A0A5A7PZN6_STRAF|nr:hydroxyproline-rich glycoprotein family protein [Striga asiatica]